MTYNSQFTGHCHNYDKSLVTLTIYSKASGWSRTFHSHVFLVYHSGDRHQVGTVLLLHYLRVTSLKCILCTFASAESVEN